MEKTVSNKNIIEYYKGLLRKAKLRYLKACKRYTDLCETNFRFFLKYGFFQQDTREQEMEAYITYADKYQQYLLLEQRYYNVKGVSVCQEESL